MADIQSRILSEYGIDIAQEDILKIYKINSADLSPEELEQKIKILTDAVKLPVEGKAVPLTREEEDFLKHLLRDDPQHTVRRFLVQVNEAGEIVSAEGILGESLGQIVRKRIRKRVVTLEVPMLGAMRRVELSIRVKGDENREQVAGI